MTAAVGGHRVPACGHRTAHPAPSGRAPPVKANPMPVGSSRPMACRLVAKPPRERPRAWASGPPRAFPRRIRAGPGAPIRPRCPWAPTCATAGIPCPMSRNPRAGRARACRRARGTARLPRTAGRLQSRGVPCEGGFRPAQPPSGPTGHRSGSDVAPWGAPLRGLGSHGLPCFHKLSNTP